MSSAFLKVRNLAKHFPVGRSRLFQAKPDMLKAVDGISFDLQQGRTLGLDITGYPCQQHENGRGKKAHDGEGGSNSTMGKTTI